MPIIDEDTDRKARVLKELENEEFFGDVNEVFVEYIMTEIYRILIMYIGNKSWTEEKLIEEFRATIPRLNEIKQKHEQEIQGIVNEFRLELEDRQNEEKGNKKNHEGMEYGQER